MKKIVAMFLFIFGCAVGLYATHPTADISGDGEVNLEDLAVMGEQWLETGSLPIEPNARVDITFYVGNSTSTGLWDEPHNLGRVPDFVMIFPCNNSTIQHPVMLINNETDSCTEVCQFNGTVSSSTTRRLTPTTFPTVNYVASQIAYSTNRDGMLYCAISVNKEIPATIQ